MTSDLSQAKLTEPLLGFYSVGWPIAEPGVHWHLRGKLVAAEFKEDKIVHRYKGLLCLQHQEHWTCGRTYSLFN